MWIECNGVMVNFEKVVKITTSGRFLNLVTTQGSTDCGLDIPFDEEDQAKLAYEALKSHLKSCNARSFLTNLIVKYCGIKDLSRNPQKFSENSEKE